MEPSIRRFTKLAKEPLLTSRLRGNPENRFWAKVIDFSLVGVCQLAIHLVFHRGVWIVPIFMWAFLDRMGRGQSPGKWLLGLHTIEGNQGRKPNALQSLVRNLPCLLLSLGLGVQGLWQWFTLLPAGAWCGLEIHFMFNLRSGLRVGDIFANTRVFDYKDEHTLFIEQFLKEPEVS